MHYAWQSYANPVSKLESLVQAAGLFQNARDHIDYSPLLTRSNSYPHSAGIIDAYWLLLGSNILGFWMSQILIYFYFGRDFSVFLGIVLVHCFQGRSRSVTIATAYLMSVTNFGLGDVFRLIKKWRKGDWWAYVFKYIHSEIRFKFFIQTALFFRASKPNVRGFVRNSSWKRTKTRWATMRRCNNTWPPWTPESPFAAATAAADDIPAPLKE